MSDVRVADALRAAQARSPMEATLLAELVRRGWLPEADDEARDYVTQYYGDDPPAELWRPPTRPYPRCGLALQARWTYATPATKYARIAVLDFAFFAGPSGMIAVEVDGHDFHAEWP